MTYNINGFGDHHALRSVLSDYADHIAKLVHRHSREVRLRLVAEQERQLAD